MPGDAPTPMAIHTVELGSGPLLVLGHGVAQDSSIFDPLVGLLTPRWRTLTWDAPDHGMSGPGPASHDALADAVASMLAERGDRRPVIGGLSQGGWVALQHALRHPDHVAGLVLMACSANVHPAAAIAPVRAAIEHWAAHGIDLDHARWEAEQNLGPGHPEVDVWIERWQATDGRRYLPAYEAMLGRADLFDRLGEIDVPVLVIHGEHDPWVPIGEVGAMVDALHDAQLVTIEGAWHTFTVTHPEATAAAIEPFLGRIAGGR